MSDNLTKEQRHKNMKRICAKDTKIEIILRKALWNKGYRYRKNCKELPGKPDIVLTKYKIAIFCDGSFKDILYFVPETLIMEFSRYEISIETNKLQSSFFLLTTFINPSVAGSISLVWHFPTPKPDTNL